MHPANNIFKFVHAPDPLLPWTLSAFANGGPIKYSLFVSIVAFLLVLDVFTSFFWYILLSRYDAVEEDCNIPVIA
jgi:hypothetical protein